MGFIVESVLPWSDDIIVAGAMMVMERRSTGDGEDEAREGGRCMGDSLRVVQDA